MGNTSPPPIIIRKQSSNSDMACTNSSAPRWMLMPEPCNTNRCLSAGKPKASLSPFEGKALRGGILRMTCTFTPYFSRKRSAMLSQTVIISFNLGTVKPSIRFQTCCTLGRLTNSGVSVKYSWLSKIILIPFRREMK